MSVSGLSSSSSYNAADYQSTFNKVKTDFKSLASALQSGNLNDAQQAFTTLQQDLPQKAQATSASSSQNPLSALGTALQSGNLTAAQQAFAGLQQAGKSHHHHHGSGGTPAAASTPASSSSSTNDGDADDGSKLNAVA